MSLKFRYASMLLGVVIVFVVAIWFAWYLLGLQEYLWLSVVAIALYSGMFWCGKNMGKVFFSLSLMKYIRKENGVVGEEKCYQFFCTMLPKKTPAELLKICDDVLVTLVDNEVILRQDNVVTLIE